MNTLGVRPDIATEPGAALGAGPSHPEPVAHPSAVAPRSASRAHDGTARTAEPDSATPKLTILATLAPKVGFATHQNDLPVLSDLAIRNDGATDAEGLTLMMRAEPAVLGERRWTIDRIAAGGEVRPRDRRTTLSGGLLSGLTERMEADVAFELLQGETIVARAEHRITALARNEWGGATTMPELLAAFVCPNEAAVARILKDASRALEAAGKTPSLEGYQSKSRTRVWEIAAAIWSAVAGRRLTYAEPPASFERDGQKVRLPVEIEGTGLATCLDTTLLFAAALEQAGLNAVVAFTRGHAFCGAWLQPQTFPSLTVDEAVELRKAVAQQELVLFETTLATSGHAVTFSKAARAAERQIAEEVEAEFVYALDIRQARGRQIRPLADFAPPKAGDDATTSEDGGVPALDVAPDLPGFDFGLEEAPLAETPAARIESWKRQLLDLTKRNRLLNLKPSSTVIPIFSPEPALLEDRLAEGKRLGFITPPEPAEGAKDKAFHAFRTGDDLAESTAKDALERGQVVANLDRRTLDAALVNLYRKARSDLEEGGANTLFLALGMLKWRPQGETKLSYRAPLVMLPVRLERRSAKAPLHMARHDDDPVFNMTLVEMLRQEFDIQLPELAAGLPEDHAGLDLKKTWDFIRHRVRETPGFEVVEEVCLSTFSFAKFLMWKDLADRTEQLKASPFVRHMIDAPREPYAGGARFMSAREIDTRIGPGEIFAPFNADSSQVVAIHASGQDGDFVLEGPPGTGKSETICNIIAHNLALGRRVLFVAEKQAALEVVRRRMEERGLGRFCLDLHANHANKKAVLDQLRLSWENAGGAAAADWQAKAVELGRIREALNGLAGTLHRPWRTGVSVREAIGRAVRFAEVHPVALDWGGDIALHDRARDRAGLAALEDLARRLGQAFGEITPEDRAAFAPVGVAAWSFAWVAALAEDARSLPSETAAIRDAAASFCSAFGLPAPDDADATLASLAEVAKAVMAAGAANLGFGLEPDGRSTLETLGHALIALDAYRKAKIGLLERAPDNRIADAPVSEWRAARDAAATRRWPMRVFARRRLRQAIATHLGLDPGLALEREIDWIADAQTKHSAVETLARELPQGTPWRGLDTDIARAGDLLRRAVTLREAVTRLSIPGLDPIDARAAFRRMFVEGRERLEPGMPAAIATKRLVETHHRFGVLRDAFLARAEAADRTPALSELDALCQAVGARSGRLNPWCAWIAVRREAEAAGLGALVSALERGVIPAQDTREAFRTAYRRWLAPLLVDATPELRTFSAVSHEDLIRTFRALDQEICDTTAEYIRATLSAKVPSAAESFVPTGYGVLRREIAKRTRHKPVRNLVSEMGEALLTLTPCMMMSPLSVAQFLPPDAALFDLVVFDEASQITVADAIGAIARGKRVVVVGDPKQMPPTSFFDKAAGEEGDDDAQDLESILDEALAASAPLHRLTGHYRSRHESLIAFSNHAYYGGELVTYPSADTRESAVTFRRIEGVYAKGKGRTNPTEAKAVVAEVVRRLRDPALSALSLGVVTLNAEQQKLILDLLDHERRADPELERFFSDEIEYPVFVKNLETVQGDQRDVILLSVTYGPTEPGSRAMSMNFGPLNKTGGERRLNVAITRATTEVVVFASFDPTMIDLSRTSARAVHDLRGYLDYAARGPVALGEAITAIGGDTAYESDFEMAVADGLRARGWTVQTQIGVSRFRIDLGVVDPDAPSSFLAGVECDGATYHASPSARDRDRVRHAILERLGWRLLRVWSTDFFIDPRARLDRLDADLRAIFEAVRAERAAAKVAGGGEAISATPTDGAEATVVLLPSPDSADEGSGSPEASPVTDEEAEARWKAAARAPISTPHPAEGGREKLGAGLFPDGSADSRHGAAPRPAATVTTLEASPDGGGVDEADDESEAADIGDNPLGRLFYEDSHLPRIAEMALSIIDREGPVRLDRVVSQVARNHGFRRAGKTIRTRINGAIGRRRTKTMDDGGKPVFWPAGAEPAEKLAFRGLVFDGIERDWCDVPDAELLDLAERVLAEGHDDPVRAFADRLELKRLAASTKLEIKAILRRAARG